MKKRILCAAMALLMTAAMAGCGNKSDDHDNMVGVDLPKGDVAEADLPYGATIVELKKGDKAKVKIAFDRRYFGDRDMKFDDMYLLSEYYEGLNKNDHAELEGCFYPGYLAYIAEQMGSESLDAYIDDFRDSLTEELGENFEINYIEVSENCDLDSSYAEPYIANADGYISSNIGEDALAKVTSRAVCKVGGNTMYKSDKTGSGVFIEATSEQTFCIYCLDGKYYLF